MPLFSIIIPIFNGAKYLPNCLNSIINQTFVDWEAILIDDCSTDTSLLICKNYSSIDERFITFHNETNCGVSVTRNRGLANCSGKYILFCDCDDYYNCKALEIINKNLNDEDCLIFGYNIFFDDYSTQSNPPLQPILDCDELIINMFSIHSFVSGYIWNKVYKKDLFKKVLFNDNSFICEDIEFNLKLFLEEIKFKIINFKLYNYYSHTNSSSHQNLEIVAINGLKTLYNCFIITRDKDLKIKEACANLFLDNCVRKISNISNKKNRKFFLLEMKECIFFVKKYRLLDFKHRLYYCFYFYFYLIIL